MLNNNFGDDFKKGHRLSAADIKRIAAELKRQQRLSVSAPLQLSSGAHGNHISLNLSKADQVIACKAGETYEDHPTYSTWLASVGGSGLLQNVWKMRVCTITRTAGAITDPPLLTTTGEVIDVCNLYYGEYIPWNSYVYVYKFPSGYFCSYMLQDTVFGLIDGDLTSGGPSRNLTLSGTQCDLANGTVIPISSHHVPTGKKITSGAYCWANKIGRGQYRITGSNRAMVDA